MVRVYADMVADLFHHGHVLFLQRARSLGDYLIVGIHADDVVMSYKRRPILTYGRAREGRQWVPLRGRGDSQCPARRGPDVDRPPPDRHVLVLSRGGAD